MSEVQDKSASFFDLYSQGNAVAEDIGDFVGAWHDSAETEARSINEFLGMTEDEYALWVMDERTLPLVVVARGTQQPLRQVIAGYLTELQAAGDKSDRSAIVSLSHWVHGRA